MVLITTHRNPKMEDYLDPYYSVYHFRLAYDGVIKPLPDKSQWASVDPGFKVLPPLDKRLEDKGNLEYLAAQRTREANLRAKACGKCSAKTAYVTAIG